jgi:hypothetical protein
VHFLDARFIAWVEPVEFGPVGVGLVLGARAFHPRVGGRLPFFLTMTSTLPKPGRQRHVDISMWFGLGCDRAVELRPDPGSSLSACSCLQSRCAG